jgi:CSLREA domain-containing protein
MILNGNVKVWLGAGLAVLLLSGLFALPAMAATIVVDTLEDVVAEDGQCSLREAIMNANGANQSGSSDCVAGDTQGNRIVFDPDLAGATISIQGLILPAVSRPLLISGPLEGQPDGLTLDGNQIGRVLGTSTGGHLVLRDLTITGGFATGSSIGGGVVHDNATESGAGAGVSLSSGQLTILDSSIVNNTATSQAGGIRLSNVTGQIVGSTIAGNWSGSSGGGMYLHDSTLDIINSTFSDNGAAGNGGALQVSSSELTLIHASLVFNHSAQVVHGINLIGNEGIPTTAALHNSLILQSSTDGWACYAGPYASLSGSGSLSTHSACPGATVTLEAVSIGPLDDYGGLTRTHGLAPGSVAIGAAGSCGFEFGLLDDQRGQPRPGGASSLCDVGAYESQFRGDDVFSDRFQGE